MSAAAVADMTPLEYRKIAVGLTGIQNLSYLVISVVEGAAWAMFGTNWYWQMGFLVWAVLMVWSRLFLSNIYIIATVNGDDRLASRASGLLKLSIIITMLSMMSLYSTAIKEYVSHQIKNAGPVLLAQSELNRATLALENAEKNSGYTKAQIADAVQKNVAYQAELKAAETAARSAYDAQTKKVEAELDAFWATKSFKHEHANSAVMDENCVALKTNYGVMTSNANELCPKLKKILAKFPDVSSDPAVASAQAKIAAISGPVAAHSVIESAKMTEEEKKAALHQAQNTTGVASGDKVYPPIFHDIHEMLREKVSVQSISTLFGILAIGLVLLMPTVFQEGRALVVSMHPSLAKDTKEEAESWLDKLPGGNVMAKVSKPHAPDDKDLGTEGKVAQARTGARVVSDGLMLVHANNHILNEGGVKIAEERGIDLHELNRAGLARMNGTDVPVQPEQTVPAAGTSVPDENDMGRVSKAPQRTRKVQSNQSGKVRSDTGTTGAEAHRYQRVRKAVVDRDQRILKQDGTVSYGKIRDYSKHVPDMREINLNVARDTFFPALVRDKIINQKGEIL